MTVDELFVSDTIDTTDSIINDAIINISQLLINSYYITKALHLLDNKPDISKHNLNFPVYLGNYAMLCKMRWGGFVVAPTWNIDVAPGAIKNGIIESHITKFISDILKPGYKTVNVGANFGYYTCLHANKAGSEDHVFSFEANPVMFIYLLRTLYYGGIIHRVSAYHRAVSNTIDELVPINFDYQFIGSGSVEPQSNLPQIPETMGNSSFWQPDNVNFILDDNSKFNLKGLYNKISVPTTTLDKIINEPIDLIQIDAEGSEAKILLGAEHIIKISNNIKIIFEWGVIQYNKRSEDYRNICIHSFLKLYNLSFSFHKILLDGTLSPAINSSYLLNDAEFGD